MRNNFLNDSENRRKNPDYLNTFLLFLCDLSFMDDVDEQILDYLQEDGRASFTDIADDIGVSEGTVRNRVQQLQEDGIIERFTVEVSESERIAAVVMAVVNPAKNISNIIHDLPGDVDVSEITGEWDLVLRLSRPTSEALNEALEKIRKVDGVTQTQTYTVLASHRR